MTDRTRDPDVQIVTPKTKRVTSLGWNIPLPSGAVLDVRYLGEVTEADVNFVRRAMPIITGTIELARTDDDTPLLPCQHEEPS